ncbi:lysosome-associated membrane glycoprotein 2 isoform X2 [Erpetoichthys calabaricus]|uniref:Lysosome-associated membrane glycoprotein 2 n=1 Tax=Erpetoichthys calabaricus TaxID=27687 RepID=A0A8C4SJF2_ERPCA|nr:lysosome-associated membrane glycoprotein 2 isoform X2 [Erpetoichthys calabaricus]
MESYKNLLLLIVLGCGVLQSCAMRAEVYDNNNETCLYADMELQFTIKYETSDKNMSTSSFLLPSNVSTTGSTCGDNTTAPLLKLDFGDGHSFTVNFTHNQTVYHVDVITFVYNTNDSLIFPNASAKGVFTVASKVTMPDLPMDDYYKCVNPEFLIINNVTMKFSNVSVQAYIKDGNVSKQAFECDADTPTTLAPNVTTHAPNVTTHAPNVTTGAPITTPVPTPIPKPETGNYLVKTGNVTCLLADMGLQLNFSTTKNQSGWKVINIVPNDTLTSGTCGIDTSSLKLQENQMMVELVFAVKNSTKFYLNGVNVSISGQFADSNNSLEYWEASIGSSYMCNKNQNFKITDNLFLTTLDLRVQPFNVTDNKFSTAEECFLDSDLSFLVPIAVGVALGFLILLVLISYIIGRKKSHTGYQSV